MEAIRILTKCAASGQHLPAGKVCKVPSEVSEKDAAILVRIGRAEAVEPKAGKAKGKAAPADDTAEPKAGKAEGEGSE